jgi:hypothetical protein
MRFRRHREQSGHTLIAESIYLLEGRSLDLYVESGRGIPAWARVNALAHSTAEQLASFESRQRLAGGSRWEAVMGFLAGEIRSIGHGRPERIAHIQASVLIPLELAMLDGEVAQPASAGALATLVLGALERSRL